ncbi:MAG: alpha/beta hydrolase [Thiohalocapsa sp.]|uniref:alpha/beta hydrolase n=1 Tax=Thiohalocapsa sp. TaxID=2497641 RepID=UPI0025F52C7E|nr:alpha/beta hydrolase [Thiohalocapsa sp.]MCG6941288.1 alpha/beta hydrolase [Thiohalocapsa sp.]
MPDRRPAIAVLAALLLLAGCATQPRQLMPTPVVYQEPGGEPVLTLPAKMRSASTDVDLLYITDRGRQTDPESDLPYGQDRSRRLIFGSVRVKIGTNVPWPVLERESRLGKRTRDLPLSLGRVEELGSFPKEPYAIRLGAQGYVFRDQGVLARHTAARRQLQREVQRRLAHSPRKEVMLYVHGFNETFTTAAYTAADLCHFLGREPVCAFFTWPASSTGNFLISYTNTTESADYAVNHLKKTIRALATTPGVEHVQLLAHSRGTALMLNAVRQLFTEAVAAGKEPADVLKIDNVVFFSPDIDVDVGSQEITAYASDPDLISVWPSGRLPRSINGRFTVYSSPSDRALLVSRILFRSNQRVGNLRAEDISFDTQNYLAKLGNMDLIVYEGKRTDAFGHSYFTTNPRVSSDVMELLRYGKKPGDPGRDLVQVGPVVWKFPAQPK